MATLTPQPTAAPSTWGLSSYVPASSQSLPTASNYQVPASSQSTQLNAYGTPLYQSTPYTSNTPAITTTPIVKTNPSTGTFQPTPSPAPAPSGTKSITEQEAIALGLDWNNLPGGYSRNVPQQQGPSEADLSAAYNPIFDYLNQAESQLRADYPNIQKDITNQYNVSAGTLGSSRDQGMSSLDTNASKVQQTKEDAMSQARRLYNELMQGYNQRFGGSTSAGEAARVLAGNEAQRTMGGVNRDYGNNIAAINQKKVEVEQNYQNQLLQLQATRDSALNQANRDFQQKLLDISNSRATTASDKAQQKLAALQELRNQAYNIQLQNMQFQQQLALQKQADSSNLDSYLSQLTQATTAGNAAQNAFNPTVSSNLQIGNTGLGGQSSLTGQITNRKDLTNQYTGAITPQTSSERLFNSLFGQ